MCGEFFFMDTLEEQCVCMKFCFKLEKSSNKTLELQQQAFEDDALSRRTCFERFKWFKKYRTSIKDNKCSGRPLKQMNQ